MPDPMVARNNIMTLWASIAQAHPLETPVVVYFGHLSAVCAANCLAYHDDTVLNSVTRARPTISVPEEYHNSYSRVLCFAQCLGIFADPAGPNRLKPLWELWELEGIQGIRPDVQAALAAAAGGDPSDLGGLLVAEDYHPFLIGHIAALEIASKLAQDGWNAQGALSYDWNTGQPVPCTANCEKYGDITGYAPRNVFTGKQENDTAKYIVEGNDKYWQPLYEDNGLGTFTSQKHVTPHVGITGKPFVLDSLDSVAPLDDPEYDFLKESEMVVERLRETSGDNLKKQKIALYDDKILVRGIIQHGMRNQVGATYSYEDEVLFLLGISSAENDALLLSWREKVRHDIVRPTTVIKRWGSDVLETFGGDKAFDGPVNISARDFQAFQRVMPHSEFPSGSSCLCTAYTEFTDAYTSTYFSDVTLKDLTYGEDGFSIGCVDGEDPFVHKTSGCDSAFVIPDIASLKEDCSQSRLWGGFHFTASVPAGQELCTGVGGEALSFERMIRNNSTLGSKFHKGDSRPQCSTAGDADVAGDADAEDVADVTEVVEKDESEGGSLKGTAGSSDEMSSAGASGKHNLYLASFFGFILAVAGF
eukprot:Sro1636_g287580.1 n/a (589) ;mRNA; r:10737-12503